MSSIIKDIPKRIKLYWICEQCGLKHEWPLERAKRYCNKKCRDKAEEYSGWLANEKLSGNQWRSPAAFPFYYETDGRSIPGQKNRFDFIYSMVTFQHIPEEGVISYINEASRVLKQGGVFRFQYIEGTEQENFSRHYKQEQIEEWLAKAGFNIKSLNRGLVHDLWTWVTAIKL